MYFQATEESQTRRESEVVVNIPLAGDDNLPLLDSDLYQAEILDLETGLTGDTTFTASDPDILIPSDLLFRLVPGGARTSPILTPKIDIQTHTALSWNLCRTIPS